MTVFDSTGFALEDHVAFDVLLELAEEAGIGDVGDRPGAGPARRTDP
jgi:ornithine cyclodeaminase/alanine dehydrogenase-like protein (mu-crystallin family)